jgi:probable phosphoglycerate mutase
MRHILLLRHGQTNDNARGVLQGHSETNLNALGREQADALATRLSTFVPTVDALVVSDLARARETAAPVERALGLRARVDPRWRERGFGEFEGRTIADAEAWRATTGAWDLPGAEDTVLFHARIHDALMHVAEDPSPAACVGVITHGAAIRTVLHFLAEGQLTPADGEPVPESVPIANCAILHLSAFSSPGRGLLWRVACVNDVSHLSRQPLGG